MFKVILTGIGGLALFLAFVFGMNLFGLANYSFFAPKYRAAENQVFKESEQYNDGMIRDLENLQMEYIKADAAGKASLKAITLHRFSVYPEEKMPANLRNFYNQLRSGAL
jgi:hypothetical protein